MPNGHGVPLGCFVCCHYERGSDNPLWGNCRYHQIDVDMDKICSVFIYHEAVANTDHSRIQQFVRWIFRQAGWPKPPQPLTPGFVYAYVDVPDKGYPPPVELVPWARIDDLKQWDEDQIRAAYACAIEKAKELYTKKAP